MQDLVTPKAVLQQIVCCDLFILVTRKVCLYARIAIKAKTLQPLNRSCISLCELDL
jgi:hypothetical protein